MKEIHHVKSYATDTRLMGVIAIKSYIEDKSGLKYVLLCHLDFETNGLDGLDIVRIEDDEWISERIYGGLGGQLVEISLEEASYLISRAKLLGIRNIESEKEPWMHFYDCENGLTQNQISLLNDKITVSINSRYERINYFLMRYVGNDIDMIKLLYSKRIELRYQWDSTLIKNIIEKDTEKAYVSKALVLIGKIYYIDRYLFVFDHLDMINVEFIGRSKISYYEAAMQLKNEEYINVYQLEEAESIFHELDDKMTSKMVGSYPHGLLMTKFHKDNSHVNRSVYFLNGDVEFYLFFTDENQMIITCKDLEEIFKVNQLVLGMISDYNVTMLGEFGFNHQVLFDFIQSDVGDFIEFISEELD